MATAILLTKAKKEISLNKVFHRLRYLNTWCPIGSAQLRTTPRPWWQHKATRICNAPVTAGSMDSNKATACIPAQRLPLVAMRAMNGHTDASYNRTMNPVMASGRSPGLGIILAPGGPKWHSRPLISIWHSCSMALRYQHGLRW